MMLSFGMKNNSPTGRFKHFELDSYHKILLLIIAAGLFIRLYNLDKIPSGFYCDEAANGYDAYSILKTGSDSRGQFLPLAINRFNQAIDTAVLYAYFATIPVSLLGLTVFAVRLAAAFIATLTILSTFLFVKELFNKKIATVAAFLIAFSPHHVIFSRWAHDGILVPFFATLGLFFILKALKNPSFFIASSIVWGLSLYTYPIMRVFLPVVFLVIFAFYYKTILQLVGENKAMPIMLISCVIFAALAVFPYFNHFSRGGDLRFATISVFRSPHPARQFLSNMLSHFSPGFLFFSGDSNFRHNIPGFGEILIVLIPFILLGLVFSLYKKEKKIWLLFFLFTAGLIPASLTMDGIPHALRTISAVPFLEVIAAYGICLFYEYLKNKKRFIKMTVTAIAVLLLSTNIALFLYSYFVRYPAVSEDWFQYGMKDAVEYAEAHINSYDRIVLSGLINQPFILVLFFSRSDPSEFQRTGQVGKYFVCGSYSEECYEVQGNNLFIVFPYELPGRDIKKTIAGAKGKPFFNIVEGLNSSGQFLKSVK